MNKLVIIGNGFDLAHGLKIFGVNVNMQINSLYGRK